jgi:hypothetical protein
MPRGGRRPGAGRKPKPKPDGFAQPARVLAHPSVPTTNEPSPIEEFDAPDDLTAEERAVWMKQAPFAFQNRTLTRVSALSFERYCKVVVLERNEAKSSGMGGANHRGLLKQINNYELQFMLTPNGRPMPEAAPAADAAPQSKLARFRT